MQEKKCVKCEQVKPLSEFRLSRGCTNGVRPDCKECSKKSDKEYRNRPKVKERNKVQGVERRKKYKGRYSGKHSAKHGTKYNTKYRDTAIASIKAWYKNHPGANKAHRAINYAVERGRIPRASSLKCATCGAQAIDYHHHNGYSPEHWFDVIPLCRTCHRNVKD